MHLHLNKFLVKFKLNSRQLSTRHESKKVVKYTSTINLPKTVFPTRLSSAKRHETEQHLLRTSFAGLYEYQRKYNVNPEFVLHDGPPYANGNLHMGHAVNKILKDINNRQHVANGTKIDYKAGWDCHGLPIELKAMGGQSNLDPLEIRKKSRQFATDASETQLKQFQSWGIIADWNNPANLYKTFSPDYIRHEIEIFFDLYKKNLVYRDLKPVFWSPSSRTALAEAELEYDHNFESPSVLLRLKLSKVPTMLRDLGQALYGVIWTTTPWTLLSNQAICYNPALDYSIVKLDDESCLYLVASNLLGEFRNMVNQNAETVATVNGAQLSSSTYIHPIFSNLELPFLPAAHVQDTKGTGLVHTAPAHGPDDFLVSLKHNIQIKCFVNERGEYNDDAPDFLISKQVLGDGNASVIEYLQKDILYVGKITHSYPIDWRTKKPVILRASDQWFINTEKIKKKAIEEIEKIEFYPRGSSDVNKRTLVTQLEKRPYWCISRQRAWGVPIPVFYEKTSKQPLINEHTINAIQKLLDKHQNMDFWWDDNLLKYISKEVWDRSKVEVGNLEPGKDIFDIWFDSGVSWSYALGNEKIADLYLEGYDQFTGWFQSSLMTSIGYRDCAPYKSIFVHGFTVDEKGHKMSKSLGNVIIPSEIIEKYSIDVLRWWVASHGTQHSSIVVSESLLQACADTLNKIRSTLKYLNGSIGEKVNVSVDNTDSSYLDKYMRNELWKLDKEVTHLYNIYEYNRVTSLVLNFIVNQVSSTYLNLIKDRFYCGSAKEIAVIKSVLKDCYHILCKALWPIVPFVVEESWSYYDKEYFYKTKIQPVEVWRDSNAENVINTALELKQFLNQSIKNVNTWTLDVYIKSPQKQLSILKNLHQKIDERSSCSQLCELLQVSSITLVPSANNEYEIKCENIKNVLCPRCRRFAIQEVDSVCERCNLVLVESGFI